MSNEKNLVSFTTIAAFVKTVLISFSDSGSFGFLYSKNVIVMLTITKAAEKKKMYRYNDAGSGTPVKYNPKVSGNKNAPQLIIQ